MMGPAGIMDWENFNESFPAYLTIAVMPLTYSIANGVVAGLMAYCLIDVLTRDWLTGLCFKKKQDPNLTEPLHAESDKTRRFSVASSPHAVCRPTTPIDTRTVEIRSARVHGDMGAEGATTLRA